MPRGKHETSIVGVIKSEGSFFEEIFGERPGDVLSSHYHSPGVYRNKETAEINVAVAERISCRKSVSEL